MEAIWLEDFLIALGISVHDPIPIHVDNQGSIALAKNPVFHDRSKHIDIQYHYTRDLVPAADCTFKTCHGVVGDGWP